MIMPRKETCSICGKDFMDGCLVQCPPICDECHGIPPRTDPNKINTQEEYLKAIKAANEKRYGSNEPLAAEEAEQELRKVNQMENRNVGLESAMIGDAVNKLPKEFKWSSVQIWFEGEILRGNASTMDKKNTVTWKDGEWVP